MLQFFISFFVYYVVNVLIDLIQNYFYKFTFNFYSICNNEYFLGITDVTCETKDFYKVPFTDVLPLVRNRRVYLEKGYAYIPMSDLVVCIQAKFRSHLNEALNVSQISGIVCFQNNV